LNSKVTSSKATVNSKATILAVDIGTTAMKMGIFRESTEGLSQLEEFSKGYPVNMYNNGLFGDIEPEKWQEAFVTGCRQLEEWAPEIDAIALSGTTPGMTAMGADGQALYPAILMLDQRSRSQARRIIERIGLGKLLETTGNMPVAGGCSLASILWIAENEPDIFRKSVVFGHSNTFVGRWLTGTAAIDPSSASLMALYNTVANDLTWNEEIAGAFGLSRDRLPSLIWAHESPGRFRGKLAKDLGFKREPPVVIGGNDAVLAAYSVGVVEPGEAINVNGTCEITLVCLPKCFPSCNYNIRAHVIPGRWLTLYVMNAGGEAFEWFRLLFCSEMTKNDFYRGFIDRAVDEWLDRQSDVRYIPYLMGSRYCLEPLKASFTGLTRESSREELMAAMVRGLCDYQREHLKEIALEVPLKDKIYVTGGAATPGVLRAKERWMRDCRYEQVEQSSLRGAALLGVKHLRDSGT
jgi:sugar (pentulose or hexulose) kinase